MAAIDKAVPNEVRTDIKLPNPKEVQQEQQQQVAGDMMNPVDIQKNEDGSVILILILMLSILEIPKIISLTLQNYFPIMS